MVVHLKRQQLPTPDHKDFINMPNFEEVRSACTFYKTESRDRVVTIIKFPGHYNLSSGSRGEPVDLQLVHFFEDFDIDDPAHTIRILCETVIAVYAIGCEVLQGKRTCGEPATSQHDELLRQEFQYNLPNGKLVQVAAIFSEDGGCCGMGDMLDYRFLQLTAIRNSQKMAGFPFCSDENKMLKVVFDMQPGYVTKFISTTGLLNSDFLPTKR